MNNNRFIPSFDSLESRDVASATRVMAEAPARPDTAIRVEAPSHVLEEQFHFAEAMHHIALERVHAQAHVINADVHHNPVHLHAVDHVFAHGLHEEKDDPLFGEYEFGHRHEMPRAPLGMTKISRQTAVDYMNGFMDLKEFYAAGGSMEEVEYLDKLKEYVGARTMSVVDTELDVFYFAN